MLTVTAVLKSASPLFQGRPIQSIKNTGESSDAFEERTWRERLWENENGFVFVPPGAIKNCLSEVAKFLGESVPGKGKATYTKHFEAGVLVSDPMVLNVRAADVKPTRLFVPASGKRGDGKRVWKNFPTIPAWTGTARIILLDPLLIDKPAKVKEYLEHMGKFIGIGSFRPRNNGMYGRFSLESFVTA